MRSSLRGYATAVLETAAATGQDRGLVDELAAADTVIESTGTLAAALSDVSVPTRARHGVVEDLFSTRVAPVTLRVLLRVVDTVRADELATALHDVAEFVRHMVELGELEVIADEPMGRSAARRAVAGYADAVFEEILDASGLEQIEGELFAFARIVEANADLRSALVDVSRPVAVRKRLVAGLLESRARPETVRLARAALDGRVRDLVGMLEHVAELAAKARGWRVGRVRSAAAIDDEGRDGFASALGRLAGRPVELQVEIDPRLLGGVAVQIGDLFVDASARHRLDQLEERLLRPELATRGAKEPD